MIKPITSRTVAAKLITELNAAISHFERLLLNARCDHAAIAHQLSDKPCKWVSVRKVALEDNYYFVQRVIGNRPFGDVCLAEWLDDYGWRACVGQLLDSTHSEADLLVLIPKGTKHARKTKPKAKRAKLKR